ncbi:alpha/beta hydrolase [Paenibacillus sp. FSL W8-1187]|uniref:Hydrolase, alpha/beta fold family n=1 Tax=Paenibacillus pasadenensis TaxID=217090 RepID=A0A2N5NAX5_9BACL|nr:alpha/beta hydrolase [Paenibacillus pasadenensis]PLT47511.1 hydrolase, alpha/beta fold family [Paenibacillus pasadenensis]
MERLIQADEVKLQTESFGKPGDPALLLIMGSQASMVLWEKEFCELLAAGGRFVIRYDNRDTGRSSSWPLGTMGYTMADMADDAMRVLDAYGIQKAHLAGMSLGGYLSQLAAVRHPERVLTVTLIASSNYTEGLPAMEDKVIEFFTRSASLDLSDAHAAEQFGVEKWRLIVGSQRKLDESRIRGLVRQEISLAESLPSMGNHMLLGGGEEDVARTEDIRQPALIVHGTEDPVLPYAHGLALEHALSNARLLPLEGAGHEIHPDDWPAIVEAMLELTGPR